MGLSEFIDFCINLFFALGFPYAIFSSIILMRALKKKHPEFWNTLGPEDELGLIAGSVQYRLFIRGDGLPVEIYTEFKGLIDSIRVSFYAGMGAFSIILIESLAPPLYSSMVSLWYRIGF